jgi:YbbR domain-containing protein
MALSPFRNIGLKFLSICIAALLWLVVAGDRVVERSVRMPIEFQNLPQGLEIVGNPPDDVDVRVRGSSGVLGRLSPGDMAAVIDLRNARPGRRLFHLTSSEIHVPYGIDVVQVAPATLPIAFENSIVRVVKIRPSIEGTPAPGYEVGSIDVDPATVEVVGPENSLRGLDGAMTEPVSVADATRPVREVVTIGVADPAVRLRTPQTADVTVQIVPGASSRLLKGVPVQVRNLGGGFRGRVAPSTVVVTVRGTESAVAGLTIRSVEVQVDARELAVGEHIAEVRVRADPGLTIEGVAPSTVRLRIAKP